MRAFIVLGLALAVAGCWVGNAEKKASQNERMLNAVESGQLPVPAAQAPVSQAEAQQAIESFYADRNRFPKSLGELVPKYLDQIPVKPDGKPFNYDPRTGALTP